MLTADEHRPISFKLSRRRMKMLSKRAAKARVEKIPKHKRRRIARNAATVRWERVKAVALARAH